MLPDTDEADEFLDETLYVVLRALSHTPHCRERLYRHQLIAAWVAAVGRHLENEGVTDKALHYLTECMMRPDADDPGAVDARFVEKFIRYGGPELILRALAFYKDGNSDDMIAACVLPVLTFAEVDEGRKWIEKNYYKLSEFLPIFDKERASLDYPGDMAACVDALWKKFRGSFHCIQVSQMFVDLMVVLLFSAHKVTSRCVVVIDAFFIFSSS